MLQQSFDSKNLLRVITRDDVIEWNLWSRPDESDSVMRTMSLALERSNYRIAGVIKSSHNGNTTYQLREAKDHVGLKLVDRQLRRIYKVNQSDRNRIVRELRALLCDGGQLSIIREDVKAFYESIPFHKLVEKLKKDMILSDLGISMVESLKDELQAHGHSGLPRGIALSATLSELYMERFDSAIRKLPCIFYLARYVDDIIVLTDSESVGEAKQSIGKELRKLGLELRSGAPKSAVSELRNADFSYLGYHFKTHSSGGKPPTVDISISKNKVNKIKRRIIKAFIAFDRDGEFETLLSRCRYLACSKVVKRSDTGDVLSGLKHNYRYISDLNKLKVFDGFMSKVLSGGTRYGAGLSDDQIKSLRRISFYRASRDGIVVGYSRKKVNRLKKVWAYE
ncbi:MAG TPA: antiviral reverse transcriptase Drt3a [Candidatus Didemnitutus sp.]|nr:antiviral reverse transcriptase Drt3a [Candidatus Didemnitutus sp.]